MIITTSSPDDVDVILAVEGIGFVQDAKVSRSKQAEIPLPTKVRLTDPSVISNKTVVVMASGAISVHCIDNEYESGDGFLALPNKQLGTSYYVMSYEPFKHPDVHNPAFVAISAIKDGTVVDIKNIKTGQKSQIPLNSLESYRHQGGYFTDLTGVEITSNKPVSVVSGIFTRVPYTAESGADGLLEQIPPVNTWGTSFVLSPFLGRETGYVYRILSGSKPSRVSISNLPKDVKINSDYWHDGNVDDNTVITINSDQPVLVFQYMKSKTDEEKLEPAMMMVPPKDSYVNKIVTFPIFNCTFTDGFQYNIHVIIDCDYASGLKIDENASISHWEQLKTKDKGMCVVRGEVSTGVHSVSHEDPSAKFTVAVYGLHSVSSYAYPAGYNPGLSSVHFR